MIKWLIPVITASAVLAGCASVPNGSIPVVDAGAPASANRMDRVGGGAAPANAPQAQPQDSGVVVMVPGAVGGNQPLTTSPITTGPITTGPITNDSAGSNIYSQPSAPQAPTGNSATPSGAAGGLSADEQLDGPVLALLTTAQQQQGGGDLDGAASSLERAQRIAPREPQVLYRLAEVRLAQGDAAQAEQFARRGLSYAGGRPQLQASLWDLVAQAREKQGDPAGAAQARERAKVAL
ncbi:tetratricopeptide repeat protein [Pseudomonas segetis]|uniref:Tetratricopeptide repeat-containing protein n=1 Tax=Pseudomonas segetis TaxID=298908 RepID=A0A239GL03_9PSED|nr:bacterial transcriptional activator domain-containing protein [Pseudomonas segetis]SNS69153.1 Tetratricopeptide repeat-containing protein [Pseudomonas segetis]